MTDPGSDARADSTEAMAARLARLETILELAPVGIGLVDYEGRTTMTNSALRRQLGYTEEEFATIPWSEFTHPDDVEKNATLSRRLAAGEIDHFTMEKRFLRKAGGYVWAALTVSLVRDKNGDPDFEIGMTLDISDRKKLESDLRAAEERFRLLVERVPAVVYVMDASADARGQYVSPQMERMLGFAPNEWLEDPELWIRQLDPADRDDVLAKRMQMIQSGTVAEPWSDTYRLHRKDGTVIWVRDDAMVLRDQNDSPSLHGVIVDVTQEKHLEERLVYQAFHDQLTGLPNRSYFREGVDLALAHRAMHDAGTVVLFIDLDNFKTVNDSFGHAAGDEVIIAAARRISACARGGDIAARLGGDEFALLLHDTTLEGATALASRVLSALHDAPIAFSGGSVVVGASVGVAFAVQGETTDTLLRDADLAMYQAKVRGKGQHVTYEPGMHEGAVTQFRLAAALQTAVADGAITAVYQPIVDLHTGEVVGLEALARWSDPDLGDVPPSAFISVAEQTGLIQDLGGHVMDLACAALVGWREQTGSGAYVSVNVSPLQLRDEDFPEFVVETLRRHGLQPASLVLEVTEGLLLDEHSRQTLGALRQHGVKVAIDDFGTGYSSLNRLRELPVDMVKIDRAFVRSVQPDSADLAFLQAIIHLASTLNLATIAEGIETVDQLTELRATPCAYGQGYLLERPGPIEAIATLLPSIGGLDATH